MLASDKAVLWACLIVLNSIGIAQIDTLIHKTPLPASLIVKIMVEGSGWYGGRKQTVALYVVTLESSSWL